MRRHGRVIYTTERVDGTVDIGEVKRRETKGRIMVDHGGRRLLCVCVYIYI